MVNTFLPYPDVKLSAACLDMKRLGKQRVEGAQIVRALEKLSILADHLDYYYSGGSVKDYIADLLASYKASSSVLVTDGARILPIDKSALPPRAFVPLKFGWAYHSATRAWFGHIEALKVYTNAVIDEWIARGYKNNMARYSVPSVVEWPQWFGYEPLHYSHRSNLVAKDPSFYCAKFGNLPWVEYFWPVV